MSIPVLSNLIGDTIWIQEVEFNARNIDYWDIIEEEMTLVLHMKSGEVLRFVCGTGEEFASMMNKFYNYLSKIFGDRDNYVL